MCHSFPKSIIAALLLVACAQAMGDTLSNTLDNFRQAMAEGKAATLVDIDNDSLLLKKDDGFYTSGMRLTRQYAIGSTDSTTTFGWRIGQDQYTASDIKLPPALVGPPDHPYAAWLYGGVFKQTDHADGSHMRLGLDLGCIGPCAGGEWMQTNLHRLINQPLPQAWSTQVRNELGVVLYADMAPVRWTPFSALDVTPSVHARFGNIFTDVGAGVTLRAGQLALSPDQSGAHAFLRIDATGVAYNATLQGAYFSSGDPHTVQPKRMVAEAELGWVWNRAPYGIRMSIIRRGNEIEDLPNSIGAQNFARLQFSYSP
jgi:lipid A 3-O-deacylase